MTERDKLLDCIIEYCQKMKCTNFHSAEIKPTFEHFARMSFKNERELKIDYLVQKFLYGATEYDAQTESYREAMEFYCKQLLSEDNSLFCQFIMTYEKEYDIKKYNRAVSPKEIDEVFNGLEERKKHRY